jgi:hypothetical protein
VDDGALLSFDEPEQTSDETAVGSAGDKDKSVEGEPQDISEIDILLDTEDDVAEARVNRKVSKDYCRYDLEADGRLPTSK